MKRKILSGVIGLSLLLNGCSKSDVMEEEGTDLAAEDKVDLRYCDHSSNKMDVYLPARRSRDTKVLLLLHGGSWYSGDKSNFTQLAKYLQGRGFACANINFRLTRTAENNVHPAQMEDVRKALDFVVAKAEEWNVSSEKIALLGASSGGHLALLYTYAFNNGGKVKAVVSMAAPANLTDARNISPEQAAVVEWFIGSTIQNNFLAYENASPIKYVKASTPPTLLVHGKLDMVVPYHQSVDLKAKLDEFNVPNELLLYENTGHEAINLEHISNFLAECEAFLNMYVR